MIPKDNRVGKKLFDTIFSEGSINHGDFSYFRYIKTTPSSPKISVVVPKKIAKGAVSRNLNRRKLQGCIIKLIENLDPAYSGVFFLKKDVTSLSNEDICKDVRNILQKTGMLSL